MANNVTFTDNSIQVKAAIDSACEAFLNEAAGELEAAIKRNSRVDTGQTRGSYEYQVDMGAKEAVIGSNYENAIWEEFGTGQYALNGDGRKTPWVYEDAKGNRHFTHGKTPNRPMYNAFASERSKIIQMAEEQFKGLN